MRGSGLFGCEGQCLVNDTTFLECKEEIPTTVTVPAEPLMSVYLRSSHVVIFVTLVCKMYVLDVNVVL